MQKKLKVGIAGYGVVGRRRAKHIKDRKDMEIVGVCDRLFKNSHESLVDGIPSFSNYRDMFASTSLDVVFVCVTNDIAPEITISALNNGSHVFCEKPPGRNVDDIESVRVIEAQHPNLKLMYGFNHRYHDSVQDALKIVDSGEFGKIINLRGVYGKAKLITFDQDDWRTKKEIAGGGVLLDQGIHMVDLMRLFAGEFTEVKSFISNKFWGYDVEDNAYALMRTSNGVVGMLHSSATQWRHRFSLDVNLEKGTINLSGILSGSKSYGAESMTLVWANPDYDNGDPKEQTTRYNEDPSWESEIAIFSDAIINSKSIESSNSNDALLTMKLVHQIYQSDSKWKNNTI